jgi:hypothetical protein
LTLYYSYAITSVSCININASPPSPSPATNCGKNNYDYKLFECLNDPITGITCPIAVTLHPAGEICFPINPGVEIKFCSFDSVQSRYMCAITNGPANPNEDAYIEWHWIAKYFDLTEAPEPVPGPVRATIAGKFIFVASGDYIKRQHASFGYGGAQGAGIGMFNPSNHNPQ